MGVSGQRVAVAGFGKSGKALAQEALSRGAEVVVYDDHAQPELPEGMTYGGPLTALAEETAAEVWVSPGIPPVKLPVAARRLVGELDLAQEKLLPHQQVVAVTGTNGKTTTVELITHLLKGVGVNAVAAGNIGTPWLSAMDEAAAVYVVEVSSFQLAAARRFHPHVAVITNIDQDHLEWHADRASYASAKWRITRKQTAEDTLILGDGLPVPGTAQVKAAVLPTLGADAAARWEDGQLTVVRPLSLAVDTAGLRLVGPHNLQNVAMAVLAVAALGHATNALGEVLAAYAPPAHRQQDLGVHHGIRFINDSKGTNPHAVASALTTATNPVLVFGGYDKGMDVAPFLTEVLPRLRGLVLLGPLGQRVLPQMPLQAPVRYGANLEAAFEEALALARPGDTVLLSPGSSSFDEFQDYTKRGECFGALVRRFAHAPDGVHHPA